MKNHYLFFLCLLFTLSGNAQSSFSYQQAINEAREEEDYKKTVNLLEKLASKAQEEEVLDTAALIYHTIGLVGYQKEKPDIAIGNTKKAIEIRTQLQDTSGLTKSCFNVSRFYMLLTEDEFAAIPYFEQIVTIGPNEKNTKYFSSLTYLSQLEDKRGDYFKAIQYGELGISGLQAKNNVSNEDEVARAQFMYTIASIYNDMKGSENLKRSLDYSQMGIDILKKQDAPYDLGNCYLELGTAYSYLNDPKSAAKAYQQALQIFYNGEYFNGAVKALNNVSGEYLKFGEISKAKAVLKQGLEIRNQLFGDRYHFRKAFIYHSLGDVAFEEGNYKEAIKHHREAIQHLIPGLKEDAFPTKEQMQSTHRKQDLLEYLVSLAEVSFAINKRDRLKNSLPEALFAIETCDALIDLIRYEQTAVESKLVWRNKVHNIYELALLICEEMMEVDKAFYFMEKSKSILLLEGLLAADARRVIPDDMAKKEKDLSEAILELKESLAENPDDAETRKELLDYQNELDRLIKDLAKAYPKYYDLKYKSQVISLDNAKTKLTANDGLIISYFLGEENIYALAFSEGKDALLKINRTKDFDHSIQTLVDQFKTPQTILNDPSIFAKYAHEIHEALLTPIWGQIDKNKAKEISFILDGNLQYIPFEALLTAPVGEKVNLAKLPYLLKEFMVGYAYSATILAKQNNSSAHPSAEVLAMAPFANFSGDLGTLNYSEEELSIIEKQIAGAYFLDDQAQVGQFLEQSKKYPIVHLSTHASAQSKGGMPSIYFNEQQLLLPELYALELPADLVVLSACETGLGEVEIGEGVMSLARGFTYAGAQSLISSLWKVNDRSTAIIFENFYKKLLEDNTKVAALHQSKLAYLKDPEMPSFQKSPYFWAGFVHIGGDQQLNLKRKTSFSWGYYLGGIGLLGLVFLFIRFRSAPARSN